MGLVVVAAAVVAERGKILLTRRRAGAHLAGLWEFPGGKLERGESPEEALVRECREECGIEVRVGPILDVAHHAYPEKEVLLLFYSCRRVRGRVRHLGVDDHVWCSPRELPRYELPPPDAAVVARLTRGPGRARRGAGRPRGAR